MADWDAEDFEPELAPKPVVKTDKWEGEDEDDDIKDAWDAESEEDKSEDKEVDEAAKALKIKKKKKLAEKIAEKECPPLHCLLTCLLVE